MMEEQQFKRNVAFKFRVSDLLVGNVVMDGDRFAFLDLADKRVIRVNVVGNIIEKYESPSDTKYVFLTLDDGSGQIKLKAFGDDLDRVKNAQQGQSVVVIGNLRHFNNELYVAPEIVREIDTKYLLIRKLELQGDALVEVPKEQAVAVKDKILEVIKGSESDGGIETDKIVVSEGLQGTGSEVINQEIQKLLEEGIIFEPRPGKVRWLG